MIPSSYRPYARKPPRPFSQMHLFWSNTLRTPARGSQRCSTKRYAHVVTPPQSVPWLHPLSSALRSFLPDLEWLCPFDNCTSMAAFTGPMSTALYRNASSVPRHSIIAPAISRSAVGSLTVPGVSWPETSFPCSWHWCCRGSMWKWWVIRRYWNLIRWNRRQACLARSRAKMCCWD